MANSNKEAGRNSLSNHFFIDVVPGALAASRQNDALHEAAEREKRSGNFVPGIRTSSVREIQQILAAARNKERGQSNPKPAMEVTYDLSTQDGPTPNFRDLARGGSSSRSQDFQSGRRDENGRSIPNPKPKKNERRDSRNRPKARF